MNQSGMLDRLESSAPDAKTFLCRSCDKEMFSDDGAFWSIRDQGSNKGDT